MPSIHGLSSGIDTQKIIKDLKQVEKQPIKRLQKQKKEADLENQVLQELQKIAKNLEIQAKGLFSFDAKYEAKKVISNHSDAIKGTASKNAENNEYLIEVKNLAKKLTIGSRNMKLDEKISAGNVAFGGKKKKFKGGSLNDFKIFLNQNYSDTLSVKRVKISPEAEKLIIESRKDGKRGVFKIKDPDQLLKHLGIFDANSKSVKKKKNKPKNEQGSPKREESVSILFDHIKMRILSEGPSTISTDQKALNLDKKSAQELLSPPPQKDNAEVHALRLSINHQPALPPQEDTAPLRLTFGPTQTINIKGIILDTYNADRERKKKKAPPAQDIDYGIILKSQGGVSEKISLKEKSSFQQIPVQVGILSIAFYTQNTKVSFINPAWVYRVKPPAKLPEDNETQKQNSDESDSRQREKFPNLIKPGQDSTIKVDGVEVTRGQNKGLDDVIDGVKLDLLKSTNAPVKINITGDYEEIKQQIIDFVGAYNKLLEFIQENSKADELANDVGKFDTDAKLKGKTGVLITNLAVRNLINGLKRRASNAYPAFREPQIKVSVMLGISTGEVGSNWQEISQGYLQVDQNQLAQRLEESPIAVKEFFGSDTNQNLKIDNGLAFKIYEYLKPYTQNYGQGIIYNNINSNKERIRQLDKQIVKVEEKADRYEDRLKREFGSMEAIMQKQKAIGNQIRNRFKNSDK